MSQPQFKTPPSPLNTTGEERCTGFEFEFTGVEIPEAARMVRDLYGGSVTRVSTYEYHVAGTSFGTFKLELDAQLLREKKYEKTLKSIGIDLTTFKNIESIEDKLKNMASSVVPFEIITPPIPLSGMPKLLKLVDELRTWKAKGTGSSVLYAFGLHLNPEIPDDSAMSLLNHLRAYVMLDPWIRKDAKINISRRLTPYINEYKADYLQLILSTGYKPSLEEMIRDYFRFDNSRNRPLDMLPVFMHLDPKTTQSLLKETLTSARPAYHYRLPNCSIEDPDWSLADEWNRWVLVEQLAADTKTLYQYSKTYLKLKKETLVGFETKWVELMNRWVRNVS
ncbi:amidoligase family protein [Rhodohalobacter sp. 8-1]|uniref:amidoligase family protein n=1 Tax=Rhodohalobacter sp. 8-1 TaxID=3131972 RepID=UPI0030EBA9CC